MEALQKRAGTKDQKQKACGSCGSVYGYRQGENMLGRFWEVSKLTAQRTALQEVQGAMGGGCMGERQNHVCRARTPVQYETEGKAQGQEFLSEEDKSP